MKFFLALSLGAYFSACGPMNIDAKGNSPQPAQTPAAATTPVAVAEPPAAAPTAAPTAMPAATINGAAPAEAVATCSATASAGAATPDPSDPANWTETIERRDMVFDPKQRDWHDAVASAPAGHRLATRGEIYALLDAQAFLDLPPYNTVVWTSVSKGDMEAAMVVITGSSNITSMVNKEMKFQAVYVKAK